MAVAAATPRVGIQTTYDEPVELVAEETTETVTYWDYLVIEDSEGTDHLMDEEGDWYRPDGRVRFEPGETYTAVWQDGELVDLH